MWTVAGELSAQVGWHGLRVGSDLAVTLHSSDEISELSQRQRPGNLPVKACKKWLTFNQHIIKNQVSWFS